MLPAVSSYWLKPVLLLATALCVGVSASAVDVTLDGANEGRTFEGLGAVSAGASSRLLIDYPEPQRSQILDYLFKPGYGAALQHLKVEIGGEVNSTDGTEPTHMRTRYDTNFTRGYEWWLMKEAKARNPTIILDCLAWGAPGWIGGGNYWSQDMADYVVQFIRGAKTVHGLTIDYTGIRNEVANNTNWIVTLRNTLNANGLSAVKIVAGDEWGGSWNIVNDLLSSPAVFNAVDAVGAHYPNSQSPANAKTLGKPIWSSEDGIGGSTWYQAGLLAKLFNRNYITGKMTKTQIWSPITAYYDNLIAADSGLMRANTPWSGNYLIAPALWATAHTTQFARPGWKYLEGGACALLSGGSMVTLKSTNNSDYSVVIEAIDATASQNITFHLTNGLSSAPVRVWRTTAASAFTQVATISPVNGTFTFAVQPGAMYTLTTATGQSKGTAVPPPAGPFPLPFLDNFEGSGTNGTPRFFSDQAGTFEVVHRADGQGQCLRQVLPQPGIRWLPEYYPYTLLGEANWRDYEVSSDVLIETNGSAFLLGRIGAIPGFNDVTPRAYYLMIQSSPGSWELRATSNLLASGSLTLAANTWHQLRLAMRGNSIRAYINGAKVAEVADGSYAAGLAGVGCGWHHAQFDNIAIRPLHRTAGNLALHSTARASSAWSAEYAAAQAIDGDSVTRWNAGWPVLAQEWLELDFGGPTRFAQVSFSQFDTRIQGYKVQGWNGSVWNDLVSAGAMGASATHTFPAVTNDRVRLLMTSMSSTPSIFEFGVFEDAPPANLATSAVATASSVWDATGTYAPGKANDGSFLTRWNAAGSRTSGEWLQLDWPSPVTLNRTYVNQYTERITGYKIQSWNDGVWVDVVTGESLGAGRTDTFPPVTTSRLRFLVLGASATPSLWEFQVFYDPPSPTAADVRFNEWMPFNTRTLADPADGDFEPWFELFNSGSVPVNLAGCYLGGAGTNRFQFQIPTGVSLNPGSYLLAWADKEPEQYQPGGDLHVNLSLAPGQTLTLSAPDGRVLDAVPIESLSADQSQGGKPDGDLAILPLPVATPRSSNNQILATLFALDRVTSRLAIQFEGVPFHAHTVEMATNLHSTDWVAGGAFVADALGGFGLVEPLVGNVPGRFFRATFLAP